MKARKVKKEYRKDLSDLEREIQRLQAELKAVTSASRAFREKALRFLRDLQKGLAAANPNNFRFLSDIMQERIRVFLSDAGAPPEERHAPEAENEATPSG